MQVWLPLPYRYVKTCLRGICLRSLQAVPGTDPPSPDSQHIPIPRLSLKLSPDAMDLLRNCCFFCWMNICQKIFRIFQPNCFLLEEETEKAVGSFLAHCCSASNVKKKKKREKRKSPSLAMCLWAEVLSEIRGNYVLNPLGDADQRLLPH